MPEPEWTPSSQVADRTLEHIVQPGEYLGAIAALHDTTPQAIAEANRLADPSLIVSGQRLVIPGEETPQGATATVQTVPAYHVHTDFPTETDKWIDVDLSEQRVVAYEGRTPIQDSIISSGLPGTPTVTGTYRIWAKVALQDMSGGNRAAGDDYYLEDVPWVQYFFEEYAFHGTYWHNNFGQPMSRGCINMRVEDAKWLFEWTSPVADGDTWTLSADTQPGTLVLIHD
jgi:lipoprotein-anchoring transpeptidase ErfK/SrfK